MLLPKLYYVFGLFFIGIKDDSVEAPLEMKMCGALHRTGLMVSKSLSL